MKSFPTEQGKVGFEYVPSQQDLYLTILSLFSLFFSLSIAKYNISGIEKFASDMEEKGLGEPKVSLVFELSLSGVTQLIKAEASVEEIVTVQEEIEVDDDEEEEEEEGSKNETDATEAETKDAKEEEKKEEEKKEEESDDKKDDEASETNETAKEDGDAKKDDKKKKKKKKKKKLVDKVSVCWTWGCGLYWLVCLFITD